MAGEIVTERLLKRDRLVLVSLVGLLFVLAGIYTVLGVGMEMSALRMTAMSGMRDMPAAPSSGMDAMAPALGWTAGYAILVVLMWWVMMVAMMLPSAAPAVLLHAALLRGSRPETRAALLSAAFLGGYLVAWAGFALAAAAVQWGLERLGLVSASMMTLVDTRAGGALLLATGIYQLTPLKGACLSHCRSPAHFLTARHRPGALGAVRMGIDHGVYCVGCCWSLMALLFVGGVMNLWWIAALAALVALEKLVPRGDLVARAVGVGLILWGAAVLLSPS